MSNDTFKPLKPLSEKAVLTIVYDPQKDAFEINGPMDNGLLFLGMLEMAKVTFIERRAELWAKAKAASERRIVIPQIVPQ